MHLFPHVEGFCLVTSGLPSSYLSTGGHPLSSSTSVSIPSPSHHPVGLRQTTWTLGRSFLAALTCTIHGSRFSAEKLFKISISYPAFFPFKSFDIESLQQDDFSRTTSSFFQSQTTLGSANPKLKRQALFELGGILNSEEARRKNTTTDRQLNPRGHNLDKPKQNSHLSPRWHSSEKPAKRVWFREAVWIWLGQGWITVSNEKETTPVQECDTDQNSDKTPPTAPRLLDKVQRQHSLNNFSSASFLFSVRFISPPFPGISIQIGRSFFIALPIQPFAALKAQPTDLESTVI